VSEIERKENIMGFCKVRMDFVQQGLGTSEDWYLPTTDANFASQMLASQNLIVKRAALMGKQTFMSGATLSEIGNPRHAVAQQNVLFPLSGSLTKDSAPIDVAFVLKKYNLNFTSTGQTFMRGIWASIVGPGNTYTPTTAWNTPFNAFLAQLIAGGWGWLGRSSTAQIKVAITGSGATPGVALNANGQPVITVTGTPFIVSAPSQFPSVRISGVKGAASVNGQQVGQFVNTPATAPGTPCNQFQFNKRVPMFPYTGGGKLTYNTPLFNAIASFGDGEIGERRAGVPLPRYRGRSRVRVLA
jgi:hypothetical protein